MKECCFGLIPGLKDISGTEKRESYEPAVGSFVFGRGMASPGDLPLLAMETPWCR